MESLREEERAVGGDGGERHLDQMIFGASRQQESGAGDDGSAQDSSTSGYEESRGHIERTESVAQNQLQCDDEGNGCRPVIEETLAFDENEQAAAYSRFPEGCDDGDGVSGGDEDSEEQ